LEAFSSSPASPRPECAWYRLAENSLSRATADGDDVDADVGMDGEDVTGQPAWRRSAA
jgi:hypothetical protein